MSYNSGIYDDYFKVLFEASFLYVAQSGFKLTTHPGLASWVLYFKIREKKIVISVPRQALEKWNIVI